MLTTTEKSNLRAILKQDDRPWPRLELHDGDVVAEVTLPADLTHEAARLTTEATALGFRVEREEKVLLSESATAQAAHLVVLAFQYVGGAAGVVVAIDKGAAVVIDKVRKLKALLSNHNADTTYAPAAHLALIRDHFDKKYGSNRWKYDPDAVEVKPIADVIVYSVIEETTGERNLLVVKGDGIEELET